MANISGNATLSYIDLYASDTTAQNGLYLGQYQEGPDGKWFRYALAGASNLVVGNLLQSAAIDTQFVGMSVTASAIATGGSQQTVNVTNGTTTVNANDFTPGSISVYTTPDLGSEYTILSHTTGGSGAALTLTIDRPLRNAWTTSTKVTMAHSPWWKVIQSPTSITGITAGVAIFAIPAASYGWVQTHGKGAVLADATSIVVGSGVAPSTTVAGAVTLHVAGYQVVATAHAAGSTGHCIPAFLTID